MKEIVIDWITYIQKDEAKNLNADTDNYVCVRTYSAWVRIGKLVSKESNQVTLCDARRIYYRDGAFTLSEFSLHWVDKKKEKNCKFAEPVNNVIIWAIEIIPITAEAKKSLYSIPNYQC